jgi:hypothetical protein
MKIISTSIIAALLMAVCSSALAQTFVLDSPVTITSTFRSQGPDVTTTKKGVTIVTKTIETQRFNNAEIINIMIDRSLLSGGVADWSLVYLSNESGEGGIYAKKADLLPVFVPGDLVTLPSFGASITTGATATGPNRATHSGTVYTGTTDIAHATILVDNIPASGIATNGIRTITATLKGILYKIDTVSTTMTFTAGIQGASIEGTPSDSILTGTIVIGNAKVSTLEKLP